MKIIGILSLVLVLAFQGYAQDTQTVNDEGIVDAVVFYRDEYRKILDSPIIAKIIKKNIPDGKMSEVEKTFYTAGFIRGMIEVNTFEGFKRRPGDSLIHFAPAGNHVNFERSGWSVGCQIGQRIGASIMEAYSEYLKNVDSKGRPLTKKIVEVKIPPELIDEQAASSNGDKRP